MTRLHHSARKGKFTKGPEITDFLLSARNLYHTQKQQKTKIEKENLQITVHA